MTRTAALLIALLLCMAAAAQESALQYDREAELVFQAVSGSSGGAIQSDTLTVVVEAQ